MNDDHDRLLHYSLNSMFFDYLTRLRLLVQFCCVAAAVVYVGGGILGSIGCVFDDVKCGNRTANPNTPFRLKDALFEPMVSTLVECFASDPTDAATHWAHQQWWLHDQRWFSVNNHNCGLNSVDS